MEPDKLTVTAPLPTGAEFGVMLVIAGTGFTLTVINSAFDGGAFGLLTVIESVPRDVRYEAGTVNVS